MTDDLRKAIKLICDNMPKVTRSGKWQSFAKPEDAAYIYSWILKNRLDSKWDLMFWTVDMCDAYDRKDFDSFAKLTKWYDGTVEALANKVSEIMKDLPKDENGDVTICCITVDPDRFMGNNMPGVFMPMTNSGIRYEE